MSQRPLETCSVCYEPTGHAGAGDGSIFRLDGSIGPLCNECNAKLDSESAENNGWAAFDDLLAACKVLVDASLLVEEHTFGKSWWECAYCHGLAESGPLNVTHVASCPVQLAKAAIAKAEGGDE